jgi:23S rRNA U2552 (ribose-2'-O)-methylase RlmE/FtsJ
MRRLMTNGLACVRVLGEHSLLCEDRRSWSQLLARQLRASDADTEAKIIAVDLQEMAPIAGVKQLQGTLAPIFSPPSFLTIILSHTI